jgi:hypothetical protein
MILAGFDRPIETTVLGRLLERSLQTSTPGTIQDDLADRTNYIRSDVEPVARERLQALACSIDLGSAADARYLFNWLDASHRDRAHRGRC